MNADKKEDNNRAKKKGLPCCSSSYTFEFFFLICVHLRSSAVPSFVLLPFWKRHLTMSLVCRNCSRPNPPEARYCYHDGVALDARAADRGPVDSGTQAFPHPFVFPSGRSCNNFDELVLASHELWDESTQLLKSGAYAGFVGFLGRADLMEAAKKAAGSADPERALDEFLARLPSTSRRPAKLHVEPLEVGLGQFDRAQTRTFVLRIRNEGMSLLHGSILSEGAPWLVMGDLPGVTKKLFECRHDIEVPVHVVGDRMRASNKPLEGRLVIESSGGGETIVVRAEVPVKPFPSGLLAGALSPRELAEKVRAAPKLAAPFFESGAVAAWYESNGWVYPVQGMQAPGLGGIQQFFEALGLSTPPHVEVSDLFVRFQGPPGSSLEYAIQVSAVEHRAVFANATTAVPWLKIGKVTQVGQKASIPLLVPSVPGHLGEMHHGKVLIMANGNQRFTVSVSLSVAATVVLPQPSRATAQGGIASRSQPPAALPVPRHDISVVDEDGSTPRESDGAPAELPPLDPSTLPRQQLWPHLVPLVLFLVLLAGTVVHDALLSPVKEEKPPKQPKAETLLDPNPFVALRVHDRPLGKEAGTARLFEALRAPTMRFGLVMPRAHDPRDRKKLKRLTYDPWGRTNNTCLRIDDKEILFWDVKGKRQPVTPQSEPGKDLKRHEAVWTWKDVEVRQTVEVVPGPQSYRYDTCLVRYRLENKGTGRPRVGIRFLLDTFIGSNDGTPFSIPGRSGLCDTQEKFDTPMSVPDFIETLERDDLSNPGTVARLQFHLGKTIEAPLRVFLGGWPDSSLSKPYPTADGANTLWEVPEMGISDLRTFRKREGKADWQDSEPDSAVSIFWEERPLNPKEKREVGFAYGLGAVTGDQAGHFGLSLAGRFVPGGEFTLTAQVRNPVKGEKLTLTLPQGFSLTEGNLEQEVPPAEAGATRAIRVVTWRVKAGPEGQHEMVVRSSNGTSQKQPVIVFKPGSGSRPGVFD
jgi:hypothetical protein